MTVKANFHTHTIFCDGADTPEEMVIKAIELGFTQLGFSGHMDADIHMDLPAYKREIARLQKKYQDHCPIAFVKKRSSDRIGVISIPNAGEGSA